MIKLIDSKKDFGTMNMGTLKLCNMTDADIKLVKNMRQNDIDITNENLTREEKKAVFESHRQELGRKYDFDWHKMYMADQTTKDGSYFKFTEEYVRENPNGWSDIPEDILLITEDLPGVVLGHPVADCPVIVMENVKKGTTVLAHCSAELIDMHMPQMMVDALRTETDCKPEEIIAYISACAGPNWTYDQLPRWARDQSIWEKAIKEENGEFKIDIRKAINIQLDKEKIEQRHFNNSDTITDPNYFSNSAARNDESKLGRQFIGVTYQKRK